ncbi:MAG: hypothetical protein AAF570_24330 [Bacteroidota bacterium]
MPIIVLKTNIATDKMVRSLKRLFAPHPAVQKWTVDTEDIDNVLRVEARPGLTETDVLNMIRCRGFQGEALPD